MDEMLILVDKDDSVIGAETKLAVHQQGLLHRAFSIFVFNSEGKLLIQQRALGKYHSAGLWANSCCGHPRYGEKTDTAAVRRLGEEMGFNSPLRKVWCFTYYAEVPGDLIEHEYDHVYVGLFNGVPHVNPDEVKEWQWVNIDELFARVEENSEEFTLWFREIISKTNISELNRWWTLASR